MDIDSMHDYIRAANPVPDPDQLDPDELSRFVAMAERPPRTPDAVEAVPVGHSERSRGPLVAIATAAVALGLVAIAVVAARPFAADNTTDEIRPPGATSQPATTAAVPNEALFTKELVPYPSDNPPPISTSIGDLEFEMLQFESSAYGLGEIAWTSYGLVAVANERLYWSTDYYNWHSTGPVDGDLVTVVDDAVIVHGRRGNSARYSWQGDAWVEDALILATDVEQFAFGATGAVARDGEKFLYSTDGVTFHAAAQPPSPASGEGWCPEGWGRFVSEPLLLGTSSGYVALSPTWSAFWSEDPVCESVVWFSTDGNHWDLVSAESPFGENSVIYEVAERDGRFVAAGASRESAAALWVSDDGLAWDRIDLDLALVDAIAAGELGWVITGASADYEQQLMMFSADGLSWDGPYERPRTMTSGYFPPEITVGDDVIFGVSGGYRGVLLARLQN